MLFLFNLKHSDDEVLNDELTLDPDNRVSKRCDNDLVALREKLKAEFREWSMVDGTLRFVKLGIEENLKIFLDLSIHYIHMDL